MRFIVITVPGLNDRSCVSYASNLKNEIVIPASLSLRAFIVYFSCWWIDIITNKFDYAVRLAMQCQGKHYILLYLFIERNTISRKDWAQAAEVELDLWTRSHDILICDQQRKYMMNYCVRGCLIINWLPSRSRQLAKGESVQGHELAGIRISPPSAFTVSA